MTARATDVDVGLHVVSTADLVAGAIGWDDPEGIAVLPPGKLRALETNPLGGPGDPARIIGTVGGRVVGCLDVLPGRMKVYGSDVPCLWASGLAASPQFRRLGVGALLLLRFQGLHHTVAACSVTEEARPLYTKLRWLELLLRRYVAVLRSRSLAERYLPTWAVPGARAADAALAAHRALAAAPRRRRLRGRVCEQVEQLPADLDEAVGQSDEPAAFHRSSAWLDWIVRNSFEADPKDRRALFLVGDGSGRPVAYFLATSRFYERASRRELPNLLLGSLQDWAILDPQALGVEQIVLLALRELEGWGVDAVEVCLADRDRVPGLWRWGFRRVEDLPILIRAGAGSPLRDPLFASPAAWRLRAGEGDYALF
jgi:GNAT superfamily N-acetyltransferase